MAAAPRIPFKQLLAETGVCERKLRGVVAALGYRKGPLCGRLLFTPEQAARIKEAVTCRVDVAVPGPAGSLRGPDFRDGSSRPDRASPGRGAPTAGISGKGASRASSANSSAGTRSAALRESSALLNASFAVSLPPRASSIVALPRRQGR